jgi:hypothetical protein
LSKGEKSMLGKAHKNIGFFIILLLTCAIVGSFLGDILHPYLPGILGQSFKIGTGPFPINLKVLDITFGFTITMNVMSVLGVIAAIIIYKRY